MRAWFEDIETGQVFRVAGMKFRKFSENTAERLDNQHSSVVYWRMSRTQDIIVTE